MSENLKPITRSQYKKMAYRWTGEKAIVLHTQMNIGGQTIKKGEEVEITGRGDIDTLNIKSKTGVEIYNTNHDYLSHIKPKKTIKTMPKKNFQIEHQYQLYLERMQLKESDMHPVQKKETKRAFMGGFSQLLVLMREDIADIENEDQAVLVLEDLNTQLEQFWISQIKSITE